MKVERTKMNCPNCNSADIVRKTAYWVCITCGRNDITDAEAQHEWVEEARS